MLGATRQATGVIIERLKKAHLIQTARGTVKILDRHGIQLLACECYGAVKEDTEGC
jgi:hypothetical protein